MSAQVAPATKNQRDAWRFYGNPERTTTYRKTKKDSWGAQTSSAADDRATASGQVGEVRFVVGWMADQMVRMGWRLSINGSQTWTLDMPDKTRITSNAEQSSTDAEDHPVRASNKVLAAIEWDERTVREVTTNLYVAGELHYVLDAAPDKRKGEGPHWRVVSVIRPDREDIIARGKMVVHEFWPHPADPEAPDAPLFGVLDVLEDMSWLNAQSRAQSASRVATRGIVGYADNLTTASGDSGEVFWEDLNAAFSRGMDDPTDISPVGIRGPAELVEPVSGGRGMKGLSWVIPDFPYDERIDVRMDRLIHRLAYGLPIPPEILLGLQAQSKATAFQVEGATYRAHIEPPARLVAQVARAALALLLDTGQETLDVEPDPTAILARKHSVADVLEAFDRGAVSYAYLREVLGIPDWAAPDETDILLFLRVKNGANAEVKDPADIAASEPITAAQNPSVEDLADVLHRIDEAALHSLSGALQQNVVRVRAALGARVRSSRDTQAAIPPGISNAELPLRMGRDVYAQLGIDFESIITSGSAQLLSWWREQIDVARNRVQNALTAYGVEVAFSPPAKDASIWVLRDYLHEWVWLDEPLDVQVVRKALDAAGG